jgi:hypothetical protein
MSDKTPQVHEAHGAAVAIHLHCDCSFGIHADGHMAVFASLDTSQHRMRANETQPLAYRFRPKEILRLNAKQRNIPPPEKFDLNHVLSWIRYI